MNHKNRRNFIKKTALAGLGTMLYGQSSLWAKSVEEQASDIETKEFVMPDGKTKIKPITFLVTSDIHAQLKPHDEFFWVNEKPVYQKRGGLAHLKTMLEQLKKNNPGRTIVYDGGDFFHGHAIASLTEGEAYIPVFNSLNYDLMLPGNWEVVYKKKRMLYDMGHADAAKICANMYHQSGEENNGELVYPPYWIKVIDGIKIGCIGYTDHLIPKRQSPAYSEGLRFEHADKNLARYVSLLRETEGCQLILVMTHIGLAQQVGLANNPAAQGVDLIIGADTHERVREPIKGKYTQVVECGAFASFVGKLDFYMAEGKLQKMEYSLLDVDPSKYPADSQMDKLIQQIYAPFEKELNEVLGYSKQPLVRYYVLETPMDNLITDAIAWKFKPDIALSNGFRFCQPLSTPNKEGLIPITKEFLWNMLPVNSEAKMGIVSGKQVWDWLEKELQNAFAKDPGKRFGGWFVRYKGMEVSFTIANEYGKRVQSVNINGEALVMDKNYTMVACEREGDPDDTLCRMEGVKSPKKTGVLMHDVIIAYLKENSPVDPKIENRAKATDEPSTLLTQLKGTTYTFR